MTRRAVSSKVAPHILDADLDVSYGDPYGRTWCRRCGLPDIPGRHQTDPQPPDTAVAMREHRRRIGERE